MKYAAILLLSLALPCWSQSATTTKNDTSGPCSPITTGHNNNYKIECNIDTEQGKKMLDIMNKILANQGKLSFDVVNQKLDEILKALNPNVPVKTYFCDGRWRTMGPSANAGLAVFVGGDNAVFQRMISLANAQQFQELLGLCKAQMTEKPEWLTPDLACGVAYLGLGDKANAAIMLKDFDSRTGPAYDIDGCKQMSDFIRTALSQ